MSFNQINKIAIIGVGLIGGSIALGLKKKLKFRGEIYGVCRTSKSIKTAIRMDVIDRGTRVVKDAAKDAELVIVAVPVGNIVNSSIEAAKYCKKGAVIFDVGSTKLQIVKELEKKLPGDVRFVGCHPMAGSEKSGVQAADLGIFRKSVTFLTRTKNTDKKAAEFVSNLWKKLGSNVVILSPEAHDNITAHISHLPHILAASLVNFIPAAYFKYSGKGLIDMTRIASSHSDMWRDICTSNAKCITKGLRGYISHLNKIAKILDSNKKRNISKIFSNARLKRDKYFGG